MNQDQNQSKFSTDSIALAAFLSAEGCKFLGLDKTTDSSRFEFLFESSQKTQELTEKFWKSEGRTEPKNLLHYLKDLKSLIYQRKGGEQ